MRGESGTTDIEPDPSRESPSSGFLVSPPSLPLPKGGGAIRGIGEKFSANPTTGTASLSVPIYTSQGRGGFGPQLALSYDSGSGNGIFGLGWSLSLPSITRKTDKGLPRYRDVFESDVFILAGSEDLVPVLDANGHLPAPAQLTVYDESYSVRTYRPRVEDSFALIERWVAQEDASQAFWRTVSRDNVTTWYGRSGDSRIADPDDPTRIFQWLPCETHDDRGNVCQYRYVAEDAGGVNLTGTCESNRTAAQRTANRYPDSIRYGNLQPYLPTLQATGLAWPDPGALRGQQWLFEVVFDYGDHAGGAPTTAPSPLQAARSDPFSSHRAGFEIRTYRLCRRVLMFHHFPDELGATDYLVRSTDFDYLEPGNLNDPNLAGYTLLRSVTQWSYQKRALADATYEPRQLPPLALTYSAARVDPVVHTVSLDQLENLPVGINGPGYQWIDLDGEGLSGVLTEQAGAWYYKANLGDATFAPARIVARQPAMAALSSGRQQFLDLDGDGELELVELARPAAGYQARDRESGWKRFVPFISWPNVDWSDPNLRLIDLTGDGLADVLITEQEVLTWYPSLGDAGFAPAERSFKPLDEDSGACLVFADATQTIFTADMSGDGLADFVRIRNGEICLWPNLGYGRFGRKVTLANAPLFDTFDNYDPRRIRLADIDGSGPTDIIYLGRTGAQLYFNRSGNAVSDALIVDLPVAADNLSAVQVADLLGNGTACLVWNSGLPADAGSPTHYIDLMGGAEDPVEHRKHEKPHLLIGIDNSLGGTREIEYTPSTRFYLQDRRNGTPWATRLPFPVHCVSKVTVRDEWRRTAFSSVYSYHHGYFDGLEREFRGFARVEQIDVESYGTSAENNADSPFVTQDQTLYQPPIKTVTWYHTGAAPENRRILTQFADEYFPQQFSTRLPALQTPGAFHERTLPEPQLPPDLSPAEWREALRACKGKVLRQEVFELDIDDLTADPPQSTPIRLYSAVASNYQIAEVQPRGSNPHAVFLVVQSEALTYNYELALPKDGSPVSPDPRVSQTLSLRYDELGNAQQSVAVAYGRWGTGSYASLPRPDLIDEVQTELHVVYTEARYTSDVVQLAPAAVAGVNPAIRHYRLRLPCEVLTYELSEIDRSDPTYFTAADFDSLDLSEVYGHGVGEVPPPMAVSSLDYQQLIRGPGPEKRIVEHTRTQYFDDASDTVAPQGPLQLGEHGPRGFKYEDYKLALTDGLLAAVFTQLDAAGNVVDDKLSWTLAPGAGAATAREVLDEPVAAGSKFLKSGYVSGATFDPPVAGQHWMRSGIAGFRADAYEHFFFPERYSDPFGNDVLFDYDPYDLLVQASTDARGNRMEIDSFDYRVLAPAGLVDRNGNSTAIAFDIRGLVVAVAVQGKQVGGAWQGDDLTGLDFDALNPAPQAVITFCTAQQPDRVQARTWLGNATTRFLYHFGDTAGQWAQQMAASCSIAREQHVGQLAAGATSALQISLQCTAGSGGPFMSKVQSEPDPADGTARWIVNGLTLLNNKGKPVRQYEPSFVAAFGPQLPPAAGVSPTFYYDAPGRLIRTEYPDGTLSRVEFSPWDALTFDRNDTVAGSEWYARNSDLNASLNDRRAAALALNHDSTPTRTLMDSLGRQVVAIAQNRTPDSQGIWQDQFYFTYTKLDVEGKPLWIRDARGNLVMQYISPPKPTRLVDTVTDPDDPSDTTHEYIPSGSAPCYDIAGNLLYQHSMDSGDRWMLADAAGKPLLAWDVTQRTLDDGSVLAERRLFHTRYDELHRPIEVWLRINDGAPALVEAFEYTDVDSFQAAGGIIDQVALSAAQANNLIAQPTTHYDPSGRAALERVDFKGLPEELTRILISDVTVAIVDWNVANRQTLLEPDTFRQIALHDALGRVTTLYEWHRETVAGVATPGQSDRVTVQVPSYNERGLLKSTTLHVRASKDTVNGAPTFAPDSAASRNVEAIANIDWNARGQKLSLELGNGTTTRYTYDDQTFRLTYLYTRRGGAGYASDCAGNPDAAQPARPCGLQNLHYTYDPMGNVTHTQDDAQDTIWFANAQVEPSNDYVYDAIYRLISATGRENATAPAPPEYPDASWPSGAMPSTDATSTYTQLYQYDSVGNFVQLRHIAQRQAGQPNGSWSRQFSVKQDSNQLDETWFGNDVGNAVLYRYDPHGNLGNLERTAPATDMRWDWRDMIRALDLQGGGDAYYSYDIEKRRTRKRLLRNPTAANGGTIKEDRIYLGSYELYRRYTGDPNDPIEEIESHHLFEGQQRVLLVDDVFRTRNPRPDAQTVRARTLWRYQYGNHLGSVSSELDDTGRVISHEEFHPYGTCAYRLMNRAVQAPAKRYRYTGMERDEESGLSVHGARALAPGLCRWISADPGFLQGGINAYTYSSSNPVVRIDPGGRADQVALDPVTTARPSKYSMEGAATAIRDTWTWDDQDYAQTARNFYYERFQEAYREGADKNASAGFTVWAFMLIAIAGGVAAGIVGGGVAAAVGGESAAASGSIPLGAKLLGALSGGLAGGSVESGLEQVLRLVLGERVLSENEVFGRVALSGLLSVGGELLSTAVGSLVGRLRSIGSAPGAGDGIEGAAGLVRQASGNRASVFRPLSDEDKAFITEEFVALGGDPSMLRFQQGASTGYVETKTERFIRIGADVFPSGDRNQFLARSRMSVRAVLGHELGHSSYINTALEPGNFADEMRASIWALREKGAALAIEDQELLAQDAIDRVREGGFSMSRKKQDYLFGLIGR